MSDMPMNRYDSRRWLLFLVLAGPLAWTVQLVLGWAVVEFGCILGFPALFGLNGIGVVILILSLLAAAVTIYAGLSARGRWQERRETGAAVDETSQSRQRFMLYIGMLASAVFLLLILLSAIPMFVLGACT